MKVRSRHDNQAAAELIDLAPGGWQLVRRAGPVRPALDGVQINGWARSLAFPTVVVVSVASSSKDDVVWLSHATVLIPEDRLEGSATRPPGSSHSVVAPSGSSADASYDEIEAPRLERIHVVLQDDDSARSVPIAPATGDASSMLTLMTALVLRGPHPKDSAA
jgi:hypothetical protein